MDVRAQVDPLWLAVRRLRRRRFDEAMGIAEGLLSARPRDQAAWFVKCTALVDQATLDTDDTEMEDEGVAETLLDENAIAALPRPGTSLHRPTSSSSSSQRLGTAVAADTSAATRPITASGRPVTGFARPGTSALGGARPTTAQRALEDALGGGRVATAMRPGTSRPVTVSGRPVTASARYVRLGTASLIPANPSEFITVERLDFRKYATRPALAKVLFLWLLQHENNAAKALELATEASRATDSRDWWWKLAIGKCYYRLGLLRDAERFFTSSLREQAMVETYLWLGKVFLRIDQPNKALSTYQAAAERFPGEVGLLLGSARVYDALGDPLRSIPLFKRVLGYDSANVEAIACIASNHFYSDQPELALRYFRRLLAIGVDGAEIWSNLGLACFFAQQYDVTLQCFERALQVADDEEMADIWYNVGLVAVGLGDTGLAFQAFKIAVSVDPQHAEAYSNLGVLELRRGNTEQAMANFSAAQQFGPQLHEPLYNAALLAFRLGDFQESFRLVGNALRVFPEHEDSKELKRQLDELFSAM